MSTAPRTEVTPYPVRVTCHAQHPDPNHQYASQTCGSPLGYVPGPVRFTGIVRRMPDSPDGNNYLRCSRCNAWNRFSLMTTDGSAA